MGLGKAAGARAARAALFMALLGGLLLPDTASAQERPTMDEQPPERRPSLELSASVGALTPVSSLASSELAVVDTTVAVRTDLSTTVAFLAELDYFLPSGLGVGVQAAYAGPDVSAQVVDTTAVPPASAQLGSADYWAVSGNVMYRPHFTGPAATVVPYGAISAGIRSLSFSDDGTLALANTTDFMGTAALGAIVGLADWIGLRGELRYFLTSYTSAATGISDLQNDFIISVGATAKLTR